MFCKNCGKEMPDNVTSCQNCGAQINNPEDTGNNGWLCLGFCIPIAGLILYFVWKNQKPKTAKKCITGFLVSLVVTIILYVVYFALLSSLIATGNF